MKGTTRIETRTSIEGQFPTSAQERHAMVNPEKMAAPPSEGVICLWILLRPGDEPIWFCLENVIIKGKKAYDTANAVIPANIGATIRASEKLPVIYDGISMPAGRFSKKR
jgi:hypothetical protein